MKTLLPNKSTRTFPNYIHVRGQKIDTLLSIVEKFDNHFCKIGKAIAEKDKPFNLLYQQYLRNNF